MDIKDHLFTGNQSQWPEVGDECFIDSKAHSHDRNAILKKARALVEYNCH